MGGNGDTASRILKLGTRQRCVVSFMPRPLYPGTHYTGRRLSPRTGLNKIKNLLPCRKLNLSSSVIHSAVTISEFVVLFGKLLYKNEDKRLYQWFPTSGRDPNQDRGESDVGSQEGFMENSIIMKKSKFFI
jgi:hypothetical protein